MQKNKGFTLVELLSVMVVLGIVLVIAIPNVMKVIEKSRIDVYVKSTDMMVSAAKKYIANEVSYLPKNIGDTKEITLKVLQDNGLINNIKNPKGSNNCNGYVLVTKISNSQYEYNPHLNCVSDIGSSIYDSLMLHYKFDDFQEPTENLIRYTNVTGHGSKWEKGEETYLGIPVFTNTVTSPNTGNNFGFRYVYTNININQNGPKYITISFYSNVIVSPQNVYGYVRVKYTDGTETNHGWSYSPSDWYEDIYKGKWQKVIGVATLNQSKIPEKIVYWYVYKDNALQGEVKIAGIQMEQKSYATPYTPDIREGKARDYSGNGNDVTLQLTTTPRWVNDISIEKGSYKFGNTGLENIIPNISPINEKLSLCAWIYPEKYPSERSTIFVGKNPIGYYLSLSNDGSLHSYWYETSPAGYHSTAGNLVPLNKWTFACTVWTGNYNKIYVNGQLAKMVAVTGAGSASTQVVIGAESLARQFYGNIDDIRVYGRALEEQEIKYMYDLWLYKNK